MLQKTEINKTVYNDLNWKSFNIPEMPEKVKVRLHPSRFVVRHASRVKEGDETTRVTNVIPRVKCGETYLALSSTIWVEDPEFGTVNKNIAVIENGNVHMSVFPKNVGVIELEKKKGGIDRQIYNYLMVWDQCRNAVTRKDPDSSEWYCEIINEQTNMDTLVKLQDSQTEARSLIKDTKDFDFLHAMAASIGYRGERTENEVRLFMNAKADSDPIGIAELFRKPDTVKLRAIVTQALRENIIEYKQATGKLGFAGSTGKPLVNSEPNEDFNDRVSKLVVHFGGRYNEEDLIVLKSKMPEPVSMFEQLMTPPPPAPKKGPFGRPVQAPQVTDNPIPLIPAED